MKKLFFILVLVFFSLNISLAQRSQEVLTKKIMTASEVRAKNAIGKLGEEVQLTNEQKEELEDIIREYLDESQKVNELSDPQLALARLEAYRDKRAKRILVKAEEFDQFKKFMEELKSQQRGFGRK